MLIPDSVHRALLDAGVIVLAAETTTTHGRADLALSVPHGPDRQRQQVLVEVKRYTQPLSANAIEGAVHNWGERHFSDMLLRTPHVTTQPARSLLLVVPSATVEAIRKAAELDVSLIALNSRSRVGVTGHLVLPSLGVLQLGNLGSSSEQSPSTGRPRWGTWSVIRSILLLGEATQSEIAARAGVSQPRVSQVLKSLSGAHIVRLATDRKQGEPSAADKSAHRTSWEVASWTELLRKWEREYPGPGGVATHWYGLDSPLQQAERVAKALLNEGKPKPSEAMDTCSLLVSGDVAADLAAPWAKPVRATLYARSGVDLTSMDLSPCPAEDATLSLVTPQDTGIWRLAKTVWTDMEMNPSPRGLHLADPLQILYDVGRSPSVDRDQTIATIAPLVARAREAHQRKSAHSSNSGAGR